MDQNLVLWKKLLKKICEISDKKEIADTLFLLEKRLAENIPDTGESRTAHIKPTSSRFAFLKVMTFQVEKALKKSIKSEATGMHDIPNKILRDSCQVITPSLTDVFNFSINSNILEASHMRGNDSSSLHRLG